MKKAILVLGLVGLMASCTTPSVEGLEHVNSISRGENFYPINVDRLKLDGKHDYLIVGTQNTRYGLCHDPECNYCKAMQESGKEEGWTW